MRITNAKKVSVGAGASPDGTLHVMTASAGSVTAATGATDLVVENSGNGGISILTPDANQGQIIFGSVTDNSFAGIYGTYAAGGKQLTIWSDVSVRFRTVGVERALINSFGDAYFYNSMMVGSSTAPDGTLHVLTASAGTVTANTNADDGIFENSGAGGISILTPAASDGSVIWGSPTSNAYASIVGNNTAGTLSIKYGATAAQTVDSNLNVAIGTAAIATTATDGFLYIPTCAGAPTGTPTAKTGLAPMVYDSTNNKFWMYDGGWIGVALA